MISEVLSQIQNSSSIKNNTDTPKLLFKPYVGKEVNIFKQRPTKGCLWLAKDTKKIYYSDGEKFLSMGGNSSIFYANREFVEEEIERSLFIFMVEDIDGNEEVEDGNYKIPNTDDLILNLKDGCFYRVNEIEKDSNEITYIHTQKLTVAGSGGGGNGSNTYDDLLEFKHITPRVTSCISGRPFQIKFNVKASYPDGTLSGNGTYEITIDRDKSNIIKGTCVQGDNITEDLSKYLKDIKTHTVRIAVYMDTGGSSLAVSSLTWEVQTTQFKFIWNYSENTINNIDHPLTLSWKVEGDTSIEKVTDITIDDYPIESISYTTEDAYYDIYPDVYGLTHGAHKITMSTSVFVGEERIPLGTFTKNLIFAKSGDNTPIISINFFEDTVQQYDTIQIPVIFYQQSNTLSLLSAVLIESDIDGSNEEIIDTWTNIVNGATYTGNYTPTSSTDRKLIVRCVGYTKDAVLELKVNSLNINNKEVEGAAFNLKANKFASSPALEQWAYETGLISFQNFDWVNGGLQQEIDENNKRRQYICVKAGSTMTINYPLFERSAHNGKEIKIIFKTTNCRDYDAQVLTCKEDKRALNIEELEIFLPLLEDTEISLAEKINISTESLDGAIVNLIFNSSDESIWKQCVNKYIAYENNFYIGREVTAEDYYIINESGEKEFIPYFCWYPVSIKDSFNGLVINAQNATYKNNNEIGLTTQFCEDRFIELELSISKVDEEKNVKNYMKFWVDGIPSDYNRYDKNHQDIIENVPITIGSNDCDVYIYALKIYEKGLSDEEHIQNFIADATNSTEMMNRYNRNDVMEQKNFSPSKISLKNPDCLVHVYTLTKDGMTTAKKDKKPGCSYQQYHNSDSPILKANNVTIKVQGTSSESYVLAAANLDSDFKDGFIDTATGENFDKWSMDGGTAIPINFFCTKVNVASCEHANNALNQEWYNLFQPYKSVLRCKNPRARDTMQFTNGVIFMEDYNPNFNPEAKGSDAKSNNLFGEIEGYMTKNSAGEMINVHPRFYSIGQMGNSKDNIEVFHDTENPLECCIEVNDNQTQVQWMTNDNYNKSDIGESEDYFSFRYPEESRNKSHIDGWNRLVSWMAHSNPQPKYDKHEATNEKEYRAFSIDPKTHLPIDVYTMENEENGYEKCESFNSSIRYYYTETPSTYGYTNLPLPDYQLTNDLIPESFKTYYVKDENDNYNEYPAYENGFLYLDGNNVTYEKVKKTFGEYEFRGFKTELRNSNGELWQKDYNPLIAGCKMNDYAGSYTHDTYEYRMAKMLEECENYLIMDSILYHYLFIERHCMIDNVAKNTFWSTEDCIHWNMIKDYDNDTSDGNDNNGNFTRNYGMEPTDRLNVNTMVFNAHRSVWMQFVNGLQTALEHMNTQLENTTAVYHGKVVHVWNKNDYLNAFKEWQSIIPERCWVEDYRRKYFRPYELYEEALFNNMLKGGKKTHQRDQFETYQDIYMSSKYFNSKCEADHALIRGSGTGNSNYTIPFKVYSDCYAYLRIGSTQSSGGSNQEVFTKLKKSRVKRNEQAYLLCTEENFNNAVIKIHPISVFQQLGSSKDGEGRLGIFGCEQMSMNGASKLRELVISTYKDSGLLNQGLQELNISGSRLLETLHACFLQPKGTNGQEPNLNLDASKCTNLKYVDVRKSTFKDITIADSAPIETLLLESPVSLNMHNLSKLEVFDIADYTKLSSLNLVNLKENGMVNLQQQKINSQSLVEKTIDTSLSTYRLNGIDWIMNQPSYIDSTNKSIHLLEKLKNKNTFIVKTMDEYGEEVYAPESKANALKGVITITENAYNENDSFDIYNKYVNKEMYSNLDLDFEGNNAELCSIVIMNGGNEKEVWRKKILKGEAITEEFLSDGPLGAFTMAMTEQTPNDLNVFEFNNKWIVYNEDEGTQSTFTTTGDNKLPLIRSVNYNMILAPEYKAVPRMYTIIIKDENNNVLYAPDFDDEGQLIPNCQGGTLLGDFIKNNYSTIPYKEDGPDLAYNKVWSFVGYSGSRTGKVALPNNKPILNDMILYTVFNEISVYDNINHDYFDYFDLDKNYTIYDEKVGDNKCYVLAKRNLNLQGKITIPATDKQGKREVIGLGVPGVSSTNFGMDPKSIFFEEGSNIKYVGGNCFFQCKNLKYFEFVDSLKAIYPQAFFNVPLENYNISSKNLVYIGASAFNGAFRSDKPVNIQISSSVKQMDVAAISHNTNLAAGSSITIGSSNSMSSLDLGLKMMSFAGITSPTILPQRIRQNDAGIITKIEFYTDKYNTDSSVIVDPNYNATLLDCLGQNTGTITLTNSLGSGGDLS